MTNPLGARRATFFASLSTPILPRLLAAGVVLLLVVCSGAAAFAVADAHATESSEPAVAGVSASQASVSIELLGPDPFPGETVVAAIVVDLTDALGAYSVTLDCDPALFEIAGPILGGEAIEFAGPPFQNRSACHVHLSAFQALSLNSPSGEVSVAKVTLRALADAEPGATSTLDLTVGSITATSGASLIATAIDGAVSVATNCGNAVIDEGEGCDDGDRSWSIGEACNGGCHWLACADPDDTGATTATDALIVLRASVGAGSCDPCVCDLDSSGGEPTASDALRTLRRAVGAPVTILCPICQ